MTPKRRHHSGSVRVQRLTLKSNKRATDLLLYDIDCYVWHKNQHNSFFVEKVVFECLQVMADHRVCSGWNLSDTGGDCITGSLLPADTRDPWGEGPDSDQYALCYKLAWGRLMYDTSRYIQVFALTQKWSLCFYLSLWVSSAVSDVFFYFCGVVILQHRLLAIVRGSLQRPACSLMSAWLTSSLAQISIKAPSNTRLLQMAAVCSVALFVWVALSSTC